MKNQVMNTLDDYDQKLAGLFSTLTYSTSDRYGDREIRVTFQINKKEWDKLDKGTLYGIDLSNYLSRKGILDFYCPPVIDDKARASKGVKTIRATYFKAAVSA